MKVDPASYALLTPGGDATEDVPPRVVKRAPPPANPITTTVLYCSVMVINGGLVAAFGGPRGALLSLGMMRHRRILWCSFEPTNRDDETPQSNLLSDR